MLSRAGARLCPCPSQAGETAVETQEVRTVLKTGKTRGIWHMESTLNCYVIRLQPESWLRIRKLEAQGPSNFYFSMQANFHPNRSRVPRIFRAFLVVYPAQFRARSKRERGGVSRFNKVHAKKQIFRAWKIVFLQSRACLMGWPEDRERTVATFHFWVSQGQCQKK